MELKGKAYYSQLIEEAGLEARLGKDRELSDEGLFQGLKNLGISLNAEEFCAHAASCTDPEEILEALTPPEEVPIKRSLIYFLLFEAWRRFVKDKKTLSIFCDELDYTIALFYEGALGSDTYLQNLLSQLEGVLDETDAPPQMTFRAVQMFFLSPLEAFLYDYIAFQLDARNFTLASELLDGFYPYVADRRFFDLLRVRMAGDTDILYGHFLESLLEAPHYVLCIETMHYLITVGRPREFAKVLKVAFGAVRFEEDLEELTFLAREYLQSLDAADSAAILQTLPQPIQDLLY